ncbi:PREDICTED: aspartic proteinase CDR1-like [Nicotiana attenuata]|uniref:aspartic proteinase CDR1-like n=1 Tax=Nicotiana attenuata TaxID=49451 RepID=UPI000905071F|nr:PREDICTED: aspartic proteinase CDR1-like [Nicotiana attenuata]
MILSFYDPKLTLEDRIKRMNQRSEARISDLMNISNNLKEDAVDVRIYPAYTSQFLVPLKIGTPPVPQILTMDTGSVLLWVHCGYTIGGEASPAPLYHNAHSSSYEEDVYCETSICDLMTLRGRCGRISRRCEYFVKYANDRVSGILGFGQTAVDITDVEYDSNALILGGKPIMEGASTPMFMVIGKYFITLEKISAGNKFLDIDPSIFKRIDHQGGMLADTGATSSYLPEIAYKKLKEEIKSVIDTMLVEFISTRPEELCYYGVVTEDLKGLPTIAYHFVENAKMEFTAENLFTQDEADHFCLSIQISENKNPPMPFSVLGVWAQQFFYIGFDFNTMRMSFTRIDCDRLFD